MDIDRIVLVIFEGRLPARSADLATRFVAPDLC